MVSEHLQVVMVDFFMADQLCSQVPMLRSMEYLACYYISGSYRTQDHGFCINTKHNKQELQSQHHAPLLHLPLFFYSYRKPASQWPSPLSGFFHEKSGKQAAAVQSTIRSTPASLVRAEQRDAGGHGPDK